MSNMTALPKGHPLMTAFQEQTLSQMTESRTSVKRERRNAKLWWLTTAPHPWKPSHTSGYDQGQVGWRRHAVVTEQTEFKMIDQARALCGLRAKHGWGLDLFIEDECSRCCAKIEASPELTALADAADKREGTK